MAEWVKTDWFNRVFVAMMVIGGIAVWVALVTACGAAAPRYESPYELHSEKQRAAAVAIHVQCLSPAGIRGWTGSGVITGKHTIVTAHHIVACNGLIAMYVRTLDGALLGAQAYVEIEEYDIAKITTEEVLPYFTFKIGPKPRVGATVCSESARPTRARKCGKVTESLSVANSRDLGLSLHVEGGNSGSGLYDSEGRLVGIVTRRLAPGPGGRAASLWAHRDSMQVSY